MSSKPDPSGVSRLHELDALRGLAALSVVFLHFHDMWLTGDPRAFALYQRVILYGLRFFYTGSEAVILFFVLSGLVLALPYVRNRNQNYQTFVVRRVFRIWIPYIVALALAVACDAVWHNHAFHGVWASHVWFEPPPMRKLLSQIPLIGSFDGQFLFVSWTLQEELRISLIFPLIVAVAIRLKGGWQLLLGGLFSLAAVLVVHHHLEGGKTYDLFLTVHYIGFFIVGIFLATHLDDLRVRWEGLSRMARIGACACTFVAYMYNGSIAQHLLRMLKFAGDETLAVPALAQWVAALGACGWIILGIYYRPFRRLLVSRAPQFLGKISFSLYLVHPIVLFSMTFALGNRVSWWVQFPLYVAAAILLAWLFYLLIESPSIQLGRRVRL